MLGADYTPPPWGPSIPVPTAAANVQPYPAGEIAISLATAATGDVDFPVTQPFVVVDVVIRKVGAGGAGDTCTIKRGANAVTDAIDLNVADNAVKRAGTLVAAQVAFAAGDTLRVSRNTATNTGCAITVIVRPATAS